jgi:hypothetical protein
VHMDNSPRLVFSIANADVLAEPDLCICRGNMQPSTSILSAKAVLGVSIRDVTASGSL